MYLYYYEGYTSVEISRILGKPQSTIRNHRMRREAPPRKLEDFTKNKQSLIQGVKIADSADARMLNAILPVTVLENCKGKGVYCE